MLGETGALASVGVRGSASGLGRPALAVCALLSALASLLALAPAASAKSARPATVTRQVLKVHESRSERKAETITTPQLGKVTLDKIAIIKIRPQGTDPRNVLVLEPGTSAAAAYFVPFAKALVEATPGWQVWAVERRENFLEDQAELTQYKFGELSSEQENPNTKEDETPPQQFFNYYLGYLGQDQAKATKVAQERVEAKVRAIVTPEAEKAVEAKVTAFARAEVEAFVVEQVSAQAFEETGGVAPAFEERVAELAAKYSAEHASELVRREVEDALKYAKEDAPELEAEGIVIGEELGAKYASEHAAELAAEGQKIGEEVFAELEAKFTNHYEPVPESLVGFAKQWGMNRTVEDLKVVIEKAKAHGGKVVLGGHSLGGSVVTAYATWDFGGHPGAEGLSGLVYDDGGSSPLAISQEQAEASLAQLEQPNETPWLAFGGIPAPDLGLFSATATALTTVEPKAPSQLEGFPFLPADLKSPIAPVTNEAGYGYSVNVGTSPESLIAAQIHGGKGVEEVAESDGLHGWNGEGALTPVKRYAEMLAGTGLREASGSEWYFPARLTLDTGAVGNGLPNPAQTVLGLHSTMGEDLPKSLHILAIDSELDKLLGGGETTLNEAEDLAAQSGISPSNLTLIEEKNAYAHNDPAGATPEINEFFKHMVPFLKGIAE
ncbi:MAG TPA: hypothetical protein VMD79_00890 [Solirubrobacteraceae bacterium]|nr:hypothetical protein [Solirubrobacteraceae bacterium]